jgi:replicative DNA helicase
MVEARESEAVFIRIVILRPALIDEASLTPEDFEYPVYKKVYRIILDLSSRDIAPDYLEITRADPTLSPNEILHLTLDGVPTMRNWKVHHDRIKAASRMRALRTFGMKVKELAESATEIDPAVSEAESMLSEVMAEEGAEDQTTQDVLDIIQAKELEIMAGNVPAGFMTKIPMIDHHVGGFRPGEFIVIGAFTNDGKSALKMNLAARACQQNLPTGIITLEDSAEKYITRMKSFVSGINSRMFRGDRFKQFTPAETARVISASKEISRYKLRIMERPGASIEEIERMARYWVRVHGIKVLFVDYLQLVVNRKYRDLRENLIDTVRRLTAICRRLGLILVTSSQINRQGETKPKLSNLAESSAIEHQADFVFLIEADEIEGFRMPVGLVLAKGRDVPKGLRVPIQFKPNRLMFAEEARELSPERVPQVAPSPSWREPQLAPEAVAEDTERRTGS